jgi:hypothetical protein
VVSTGGVPRQKSGRRPDVFKIGLQASVVLFDVFELERQQESVFGEHDGGLIRAKRT